MKWPMVELGNIANKIDYGVTASAKIEGGSAKFLRITDIQDGSVDWRKVPYCDAPNAKIANSILSPGDIVFARTGATTGKSLLIENPPENAVFASYLIRVRGTTYVNPRYLAYFFQSQKYWSQIKLKAQGAAQEGVNATKLSSLCVPLPPLDEQKRIAAILDKADALRRKRREALALLDGLTQSIFREIFADLTGKRWELTAFGNIVSINSPLVDPREAEYKNLLLFGPDRIEKESGYLLPAKTAGDEGAISKKFLCEKGVILYSKIRPYLNKVAFAPEACLCSADVYPISVNEKIADKWYIAFVLRSPEFLSYAATCSGRANIPKINREQLLAFPLPLPPVEMQREFAEKMGMISNQIAKCRESLNSLDALFASLQHRAFNGEL